MAKYNFNTMTRLFFKIALVNFELFIIMVLVATLFAFGMGYASKNAFNKQLLILYS